MGNTSYFYLPANHFLLFPAGYYYRLLFLLMVKTNTSRDNHGPWQSTKSEKRSKGNEKIIHTTACKFMLTKGGVDELVWGRGKQVPQWSYDFGHSKASPSPGRLKWAGSISTLHFLPWLMGGEDWLKYCMRNHQDPANKDLAVFFHLFLTAAALCGISLTMLFLILVQLLFPPWLQSSAVLCRMGIINCNKLV